MQKVVMDRDAAMDQCKTLSSELEDMAVKHMSKQGEPTTPRMGEESSAAGAAAGAAAAAEAEMSAAVGLYKLNPVVTQSA